MKLVGNLVFNQRDGVIKHRETNEVLAKYPVKIAIPVLWLEDNLTIAIDSTGVKFPGAKLYLPEEVVKHLDKVILFANADTPSATDAVVECQLYCLDDHVEIGKVSYAGDSGLKTVEIDRDTIAAHAKHNLYCRIEVTTASATSGATQTILGLGVWFVIDLTKQ